MLKRIVAVVITVMMMTSLTVFADDMSSQLSYFDQIFSYTVENGEITINDCLDTVAGSLIIPGSVNGKKVRKIEEMAFRNCYYLTAVVLPDTLTTIGDYAFENCLFLEHIYIPESVTSIGYYAFYTTHVNLKIYGDGTNSYAKAYAKVYELDYVEKLPGLTLTVNGKTINGDQQPFMREDTVMIPLRATAEALGYKVEWNSDDTVRVIVGDYTVLLKVGENEASVKTVRTILEKGPEYQGGVTYIPLYDFVKVFEVETVENKSLNTVSIESMEENIVL